MNLVPLTSTSTKGLLAAWPHHRQISCRQEPFKHDPTPWFALLDPIYGELQDSEESPLRWRTIELMVYCKRLYR